MKSSYDKEYDILYLWKDKNPKVKVSTEFGDDVVIDLTARDRICGIEIMNVSELIKDGEKWLTKMEKRTQNAKSKLH